MFRGWWARWWALRSSHSVGLGNLPDRRMPSREAQEINRGPCGSDFGERQLRERQRVPMDVIVASHRSLEAGTTTDRGL